MKKHEWDKSGKHACHFLRDKPGSPRAVHRGCSCPEAENNFGRGRFQERDDRARVCNRFRMSSPRHRRAVQNAGRE